MAVAPPGVAAGRQADLDVVLDAVRVLEAARRDRARHHLRVRRHGAPCRKVRHVRSRQRARRAQRRPRLKGLEGLLGPALVDHRQH
eukprot:1206470-Rhodomonas_salina.1